MKTIHLSGQLRAQMEEALDEERLDHTLGVAYTACALAFVHGCDVQRAMTAGMLHDCAKNIPNEEKISICEREGIPVTEIERKAPSLLHAKLGAYLADTRYGVSDPEILDAIRCHTTGKPAMTLLEKIIFVADYIEPNRKELPHLAAIRQKAFSDLDAAVLDILEDTLVYLKEKDKLLDPMTAATRDYYRKEQNR